VLRHAEDRDEIPGGSGEDFPKPIGLPPVDACEQHENALQGSPEVAVLAPSEVACGIAEHARRLEAVLGRSGAIQTFPLANLSRFHSDRNRRARRQICRDAAISARQSGCGVAHVHHEFSFFGAGRGESIRNFRRVMGLLGMPTVVTLHTWPWGERDTDADAGGTRGRQEAQQRAEGDVGKQPNRRRWSPQTRRPRTRRKPRLFAKLRDTLQRWRFIRVLRRATAIVVHTAATYQHLLAAYPQAKRKAFVIPLPVDSEFPPAAPPAYRKMPGERWVVVPGFISPYKGHTDAVAAVGHLPDHFRLVIAGGPHPKDRSSRTCWNQLLAAIDAANLQKRVVITGFLEDPAERAAILAQADCFFLPYKEVGQSGSAALGDALASLKPVITSKATTMFAYRSQVDTVFSSVAVDAQKPAAVAELIQRCVNETGKDPQLARTHQQRVRDRCSLAMTAARYRQAYEFARHPVQNRH
jgi:glycosyltransferase involved in cell wall biosynthesis